MSGREGPEIDSFPRARVLTTEKLQERDAAIQSISIDATNSVFKKFLKSFLFFPSEKLEHKSKDLFWYLNSDLVCLV